MYGEKYVGGVSVDNRSEDVGKNVDDSKSINSGEQSSSVAE